MPPEDEVCPDRRRERLEEVSSSAPTRSAADTPGLQPGDMVESRGFEWLARSGFLARGAVYGIIGVLALKLALGHSGETTNQQGAMREIAAQPFGTVLLIALAIGLAGYAIWRLTRAALGRGPEGYDRGADRVGALASGIVYGGFFLLALEILLGAKTGGSGDAKKTTAGVFEWPAGKWLVLLAGLVMLGVAAYQAYRGVTQKFLEDSKTEEMRPEVRTWISRIGTVGHLARSVVFGLVGIFLMRAALDYDPKKAVGLDGALAKLQQQPYGHVLLGVVAAGLIAFALYSVSDARYRRI
jgi:hypothetical protein